MDLKRSRPIVFWVFLLNCFVFQAFAETTNAMDDEPHLEAILVTTADVLRPKEVFVSPFGWAAIGLNDQWTFEVDWLMGLGGMPAGSIKFNFLKTSNFALSAQYLHYYVPQSAVEKAGGDVYSDFNDIGFATYGNISWLHLNATTSLTEQLRLHTTIGASNTSYYRIWSKDPADPKSVEGRDVTSLDFWAALELNLSPRFQLSGGYLYGNSYAIYDQNPHKTQLFFGTTFSPFSKEFRGILSALRMNIFWAQTNFWDLDSRQSYGWKSKGSMVGGWFYWQFQL
jgi:hypothetical protein